MVDNNIDLSDVEEIDIVEETTSYEFTKIINRKLRSGYFLIGEPKTLVKYGIVTYIQILGRGSKKKRKERVLDYE